MKKKRHPEGLSSVDIRFLKELTKSVVESSRVAPGVRIGDSSPNTTGCTLVRPGGRSCYPAFWIRDYAMSLEAGFFSLQEKERLLKLTASRQQKQDWVTPSGSLVPAGAIPDHITFGGKPIFFPGTIEDYQGQGGRWGKFPSLDDHFFFIHMAWDYARSVENETILAGKIEGIRLLDRLELAFQVPPSQKDTDLVRVEEGNRGVSFGFTDAVVQTGCLLFCSILKYCAAREMAELFLKAENRRRSDYYTRIAENIRVHVPKVFGDKNGWLRASTGLSGQPDVWGTAFAIYAGVLDEKDRAGCCQALADAYAGGTLSWHGAIRHIPTTDDFSAETAWEKTVGGCRPKNRYQNGAYWMTPTGWVCYALDQVDHSMALQLAREYIADLRKTDFRRGPEYGGPYECSHPEDDYRQNPVYMDSVTCPVVYISSLEE